jgi:hypothetical protein
LGIDSIVLPVRADKADIDYAIRIIDPNHQAIFVAGNIEHGAPISKYAGAADVTLYISRTRPIL